MKWSLKKQQLSLDHEKQIDENPAILEFLSKKLYRKFGFNCSIRVKPFDVHKGNIEIKVGLLENPGFYNSNLDTQLMVEVSSSESLLKEDYGIANKVYLFIARYESPGQTEYRRTTLSKRIIFFLK